mmetsp:Transcript_47060/g.93742  ORF Transcript_47060/g.93742 Transcript_47060/m.93742 type:complete len:202 (-) Transcript_47060:630-1235(-)
MQLSSRRVRGRSERKESPLNARLVLTEVGSLRWLLPFHTLLQPRPPTSERTLETGDGDGCLVPTPAPPSLLITVCELFQRALAAAALSSSTDKALLPSWSISWNSSSACWKTSTVSKRTGRLVVVMKKVIMKAHGPSRQRRHIALDPTSKGTKHAIRKSPLSVKAKPCHAAAERTCTSSSPLCRLANWKVMRAKRKPKLPR